MPLCSCASSKSTKKKLTMELELGLKIIKTKDSLTSTDLRIAKSGAGPIFISKETQDMFTLTGHLKGFKGERIKIDISKDGTQITISGEKQVQEMAMKKWVMQKKDVEVKRFSKVFRIPDGVSIDKIKAKYNETEKVLSIFMPKSSPGMRGTEIEEVKQEANQGESSRNVEASPVLADEVPGKNEPEITRPEITGGGNAVPETTQTIPEIAEISPPRVSPEFPEAVAEDPVREVIEALEEKQEQPIALPNQAIEEKTFEAENLGQTQETEQLREDQEHGPAESINEHLGEKIQNEVVGDESSKTEEQKEIKESVQQSPENKDPLQDQNLKAEEIIEEDRLNDTKDEDQEQPEIIDENEEAESIDSSEDGNAEPVEETSNVSKEETRWFNSGVGRRRVFAGSALFGFLIVLVIQLMKQSKKSKKY